MRKRHIPNVDEFSASEIEKTCRLPRRSMELLKKEGLLPPSLFEGTRGKVALYDFNSFSYFVIAGAILRVSPSIIFSTKLANTLLEGIIVAYTEVPYGRSFFDSKIRELNITFEGLLNNNGKVIPYKMMEFVRNTPPMEYQKGGVLEGDYRLLIINGRYVFSRINIEQNIKVLDGVYFEDRWWSPELIINDSTRGAETVTTPLYDLHGGNQKLIQHEFASAIENIETKVEINLSLALRNALDTIICSRESAIH